MAKKVLVSWYDSAFQGGWVPPDKLEALPLLETMGFLISNTDERVEIASSVSENGLLLNPLAIPKGCVKSVIDIDAEIRRARLEEMHDVRAVYHGAEEWERPMQIVKYMDLRISNLERE